MKLAIFFEVAALMFIVKPIARKPTHHQKCILLHLLLFFNQLCFTRHKDKAPIMDKKLSKTNPKTNLPKEILS